MLVSLAELDGQRRGAVSTFFGEGGLHHT